MDFFREISSKPWLESQAVLDDAHEGGAYAMPAVTVGLRVFLGVVTVVFSLLVVAYSDRMAISDWRAVPEPMLMWLNILVLFASSIAMQWAVISARRGRTSTNVPGHANRRAPPAAIPARHPPPIRGPPRQADD